MSLVYRNRKLFSLIFNLSSISWQAGFEVKKKKKKASGNKGWCPHRVTDEHSLTGVQAHIEVGGAG